MLGPDSTTDTSTRVLGACRAAADISDADTAAAAAPRARMAGMTMMARRMRMTPPYQTPRSGAWLASPPNLVGASYL